MRRGAIQRRAFAAFELFSSFIETIWS